MTSSFSDLGDRQKAYERIQSGGLAIPGLPLIVRLDGRAFHTYTKGLNVPYDLRLSECMLFTTEELVRNNHPLVGYTQSDEITLVFHATGTAQLPFNGRYQKIVSLLAAEASAVFNMLAATRLPEKKHLKPTFDARAWQVPSLEIVVENLAWREADAIKNSITMAAQTYYTHNDLLNKNSKDKLTMLSEKGVNYEDYPTHFKRGLFIKRVTRLRELTESERDGIPPEHQPEGPILRSSIEVMHWPPIRKMENPVQTLFGKSGYVTVENWRDAAERPGPKEE
jgi:tRNA(His) 5'-end guanylyltransferase